MGVHLVSPLQEDQGVVADGGPGLREDLEVTASYLGVGEEGVAGDGPAVPDYEVRSEEARVPEELDGGHLVHPYHVLELDDPLGGVDADGDLELVRPLPDGPLEPLGDLVDGARIQGGYQPAVELPVVLLDELLGLVEPLHAVLRVAPDGLEVGLLGPPPSAVGDPHALHCPHAQFADVLHGSLGAQCAHHPDLHHCGASAAQELGHGVLGEDVVVLGVDGPAEGG